MQLLNGRLRFDRLDAIYAAGLYDYLQQPVAIKLTRLLFSMLRPGGRLLLANFADKNPDLGYKAYMEAFMDWWLIYRQEADLEEWTRKIPKRELSHSRVFQDRSGHILYLEMIHR